jgi:hypothetical protein
MTNRSNRNRLLQIGTLAPMILVLAFAADATLRLMPIGRFSFRAWEAMLPESTAESPFAPNRSYRNDRSYGDLANMARRPDLRSIHSEIFTTDEFGFRNPPGAATNPPCAILAGSSFSAGCGVSDDETLSSQLSNRLGCRVYNIAPCSQLGWIQSVAHRLQMRSGVVFYELLERDSVPRIPASTDTTMPRPAAETEAGEGPTWMISRLEILAQRAYRTLQNDRVLPRGGSPYIKPHELVNGETLLFMEDHFTPRRRDASTAGAYFSWLAAQLRRDHLSLMVFLVPEKESIYQPLLKDRTVPAPQEKTYLQQIEERLKNAGIAVVNLEPIFSREAKAELPRRNYLYLRDDTHWNPRGIALAAEAIAAAPR